MEKLEKVFDSKWGLIIFYVLIAVVTFTLSHNIVKVTNTSVGNTNTVSSETTLA